MSLVTSLKEALFPKERDRFNKPIPDYGDVMTLADFQEACRFGAFNDYDGSGHPARNGWMDSAYVYPSTLETMPEGTTHVVWFNK